MCIRRGVVLTEGMHYDLELSHLMVGQVLQLDIYMYGKLGTYGAQHLLCSASCQINMAEVMAKVVQERLTGGTSGL